MERFDNLIYCVFNAHHSRELLDAASVFFVVTFFLFLTLLCVYVCMYVSVCVGVVLSLNIIRK